MFKLPMSAIPWSYLIYVLAFDGGLIGGCGYVVFWLGHSGWWFALAISVGCCGIPPDKWAELWRPERDAGQDTGQ